MCKTWGTFLVCLQFYNLRGCKMINGTEFYCGHNTKGAWLRALWLCVGVHLHYSFWGTYNRTVTHVWGLCIFWGQKARPHKTNLKILQYVKHTVCLVDDLLYIQSIYLNIDWHLYSAPFTFTQTAEGKEDRFVDLLGATSCPLASFSVERRMSPFWWLSLSPTTFCSDEGGSWTWRILLLSINRRVSITELRLSSTVTVSILKNKNKQTCSPPLRVLENLLWAS